MGSLQHLPDIDIPEIEIAEGWSVDDIKCLDDCNDAFAYLMSAVAHIEFQIDMEQSKPKPWDSQWLARANCALKYKKAALQIINQKRGMLNAESNRAFQRERDRALLTYIRSAVPQHQFLEWVRASDVGSVSGDDMDV